jgi:hypothetical protein
MWPHRSRDRLLFDAGFVTSWDSFQQSRAITSSGLGKLERNKKKTTPVHWLHLQHQILLGVGSYCCKLLLFSVNLQCLHPPWRFWTYSVRESCLVSKPHETKEHFLVTRLFNVKSLMQHSKNEDTVRVSCVFMLIRLILYWYFFLLLPRLR